MEITICTHFTYHPWDWYTCLHFVDFYGKLVGKYTVNIDPIGLKLPVDDSWKLPAAAPYISLTDLILISNEQSYVVFSHGIQSKMITPNQNEVCEKRTHPKVLGDSK